MLTIKMKRMSVELDSGTLTLEELFVLSQIYLESRIQISFWR